MSRAAPMRALLAVVLLGAAGCVTDKLADAATLTNGDPRRGQLEIRNWGCGTCHTIGGVPGATAKVGPPLDGIAERSYVAGVLPNTPDNLVQWIMAPRAVDPKTAMPNLGVRTADARDIAAYLYTLH